MSRERFDALMEHYLEGRLPAAERQDLHDLLAGDPTCRAEFVGLVEQEAALRAIFRDLPAVTPSVAGDAGRRRQTIGGWGRWLAGLTACLLIGIGLLLYTQFQPAAAKEFARLEVVEGEVYILADNARLPAQPGQRLLPGQGVEITGEDGRAVMRFADASRLELGAGTAYASTAADGPKVVLSQECFVFADAARPMVLVTPQAEVTIPAGRLSLSNAVDGTHLEVESGAGAQLVRKSDGRAVEVQSGFAALITPLVEALVAEPAAPTLSSPRAVHKDHSSYVADLAYSPDGRILAVGGGDGATKLWDLDAGKEITILGEEGPRVRGLAFAADGRRLAVSYNLGDFEVYDLPGGAYRHVPGHTQQIYALAFSPDGQSLMTAGKDGPLKFWDPATGQVRRTLPGLVRSARSAAFSADRRLLATGDWHNLGRVFDLTTGKELAALRPDHDPNGGIFALAFSPDAKLLAAGSSNGAVLLWDLENRRLRAALFGHKGKIDALAFAPQGQLIATAGRDHAVRLWNVATAKELASIQGGPKLNFNALAFSPDGRTLATGESNRSVRLWDVPR